MKENYLSFGSFFPNQDSGRSVYKYDTLPVYKTDEFIFFRCVEFKDSFYGKSVHELHEGNLRDSNSANRYSSLFPGQKLSYWADSMDTARKEIIRHGSSKNIITFSAYDDESSTFPILDNKEPLTIIDGREIGFHTILIKNEDHIGLEEEEQEILQKIMSLQPDCLAYYSAVSSRNVNFLFFEKGFRKLSLREVKLKMGERKAKNRAKITCAVTCDYDPCIESYGEFFLPIARKGMNRDYLQTNDFKEKKCVYEQSLAKFRVN